jgi:peptidyl-prolyl cis-trans isomerase C
MAFGSRFRWVSALFLCASVALAGCGGEEAPEPAAVSIDRSAEAATVNGQIIYVADVELEARMKGVIEEGETLEPSSVEFDEILDQLIEVKLLSMEAIARGLDEDPEARHRLETARDNILGNVLLDVIASERIDEAEIRKMYETQVELLEQQMENEARLRHILAPSKDAIDKIAAEIKAGADFAVTAARRSADEGTRMDGGDLGYMTAEDASPEFARVIREVPEGGVSRPFEDAQGWHIVKVDEVRKRRPPSIEELRDRIERYLKAQQLEQILTELRADASIVKRNSPHGARPAEPAPVRPAPRPSPEPASEPATGAVSEPAPPPAAAAATPPAAAPAERPATPPSTGGTAAETREPRAPAPAPTPQ